MVIFLEASKKRVCEGVFFYIRRNKGVLRQLLVGLTVSWTALQNGLYLGWPSPVMQMLRGVHGPFDSITSDDEISWMVAALDLGNIFSPLPCYYFIDNWGRKPLLVLIGPLGLLSWTLIYSGKSMTSLYIARILQGLQCGISSTVVPLYISEICEPSIRGAINTLPAAALNIGILFCYAIGPYVSYHTLTAICIILSIPYAVTIYHIPETPYFHLMKKNDLEARLFLKWARSEFLEQEYVEMKENVDEEMKASSWRQSFFNRHHFLALISVLFMYIGPTFTFYWVIPEYAARTFSKFDAALSPDQYTITLGIFTLIGTFPSTYLIDKMGRKQITMASASLTSIFAFLTCIYFYIDQMKLYKIKNFNWYVCLFTSGLLCSASLGLGQMYSILQSEYFPSNSRALAGALVAAVGSIFSVIADKIYLDIDDTIGMYFNFLISGIMSLLILLFGWLFMVETNGKTLAEIQIAFKERIGRINNF